MNKRFILAVIGSTITLLIPNAIIYPLFYADFLKNHSGLSIEMWDKFQKPMEQTDILATILSMVVGGFLLTTVIHWAKIKNFISGVKYGFIFGCLMVGAVDFGFIATTYYWTYLSGIVDIFVGASTMALSAGVAAYILGRERKPVKT